MLEFLWHMRGSLSLDRSDPRTVMESVIAMLSRQRKSPKTAGEEIVEFASPLWSDGFGPNWLAMGMFDRGRVWIDRTGSPPVLRYELRSLQSFVFCLGAAGCTLIFCALFGDPAAGFRFGFFAFVWLYGMNVLLAFARVPHLFKRAVEGPGPR